MQSPWQQPRPENADIATVADRLFAPVAVVGADSTLLYINAAAAQSIGEEPGALLGRRMMPLIHPDDRRRIRRQLRQVASGAGAGRVTRYRLRADPARDWRVFESIADNLFDDPTVGGILLSSRDVTDQMAHESELFHAAFYDPLTGLPNRAKITEELEVLMTGDAAPLAVAFVGIDRFKLINDSLGYTTGDTVLQAVCARIRSVVPAATVVGRFGGDLFVLLIPGNAAIDARSLLWRVVERVGEPLFLSGRELRVSLSAGIAQKEATATATADSVLRDADMALHLAKSEGGGRVELFRCDMREAALARLELEADLRRAITRREFSLAFQPIVRLADRRPVRAEALIRWHRGAETIRPDQFIPVAEETGLIVPLGDWIIDQGARLARRAPGGQVMVNLSARQLATPGLVERIARALAAHRLPATSLGFEITESLLIGQFDFTVEVLSKIRELGCRVGLDDFGTGYSSLGYLRCLPIDFLKIDISLSADVDTDPQARAVIGAIITMADALGMEAIAEGVESEAQAVSLLDLGCTLAQGYLFGRPTEPAWLRQLAAREET